jgi:DNA-binding transcriptional ArsR family regulator
MSGRCIPESAWRRSYDIDDSRAQVSTIYWQVSDRNEHALRFFDVVRKAIWQFSDHVRRPGKPLPICANAMRVFEALIRHMDFRTGRCDPSFDTISATCKLSRRTVVRHLDVLRRERLIDWARRTVKTGNAPGEGPQRKQTSNAYFVDLARLPVEILRTLRQKLGDKLRETGKNRQGSGPVPSRMQGKAAKLIVSLAGNLGTSLRTIAPRCADLLALHPRIVSRTCIATHPMACVSMRRCSGTQPVQVRVPHWHCIPLQE